MNTFQSLSFLAGLSAPLPRLAGSRVFANERSRLTFFTIEQYRNQAGEQVKQSHNKWETE
jgi:hypothetical protein